MLTQVGGKNPTNQTQRGCHFMERELFEMITSLYKEIGEIMILPAKHVPTN